MRPGEARACSAEHYNRKTGELWVGEAMKGYGAGAPRGETKTGDARHYTLGGPAKAWLDGQPRISGPLWPNPRTGNPYRTGKLEKIWKDACAVAEVDYIPPYPSLRHSPASDLIQGGASLQDVAALMGHSSSRTTAQVYDLSKDARRAELGARLVDRKSVV